MGGTRRQYQPAGNCPSRACRDHLHAGGGTMKVLRRNTRGFSLVELMVSIAVALFLVGGVVSMLASTRHTYKNQSQLSQLQDDQRLAMTLIANVVQSAGYYPDPILMTAATEFKAGPVIFTGQSLSFAADGQSITG